MRIDWHCHWVSPALVEHLLRRKSPPCLVATNSCQSSLRMPRGELDFGSDYYDVSRILGQMQAAGIDHGVLSLAGLFGLDTLPVSEATPLMSKYNHDLAELCRTFPQSFSGLAALPLNDLHRAEHELEQALSMGLIGAILPIDAFRSPGELAPLIPLLACLDRHRAHLFLHPGPWPQRVYPAATTDPGSRLNTALRHSVLGVQAAISEAMLTICLTDCLDQFPELTVQVANLGGNVAWLVERMDHLQQLREPGATRPGAQLGKVFVDTATFGPRAINLAAEVFGTDRLLFGTDAPIFGREHSLGGLDASLVGSAVLNTSHHLLTRHRPTL